MPNSPVDITFSPEDRAIIETADRDALVVANAGAGKTTLLVEHYFELLAQGFDPAGLVAFTFTEKAAGEMKQRIMERFATHPHFSGLPADLLQDWRNRAWNSPIGTIHQFCLRLITESQGAEGGRSKVIEEGSERQLQESVAHRHLADRLRAEDPAALLLLETFGIRGMKALLQDYLDACRQLHEDDSELPPPEAAEAQLLDALASLAKPIREEVVREKRRLAWIQFDDMEKQALDMLRAPTPHLKRHLKSYTHALLDEFQDTSPIQIAIVEALREAVAKLGRPFPLFYVGDPKQSIYRFRKVDRHLIEKSEQGLLARGGVRFESVRNFRSTPSILRFVNAYAAGAFPREAPSREVLPEAPDSRVRLVTVALDEEKALADDYRAAEAAFVAGEITDLAKAGRPWGSIAVLARSSASLTPLADELKSLGIPFSLRGGQELLERQEIIDLIRLLTFLHDPADNLSLVGTLRSPLFLISDAALFLLREKQAKGSLWDYLKKRSFPDDFPDGVLPDRDKLAWAVPLLESLAEAARLESPSRLLTQLLYYFEVPALLAGAEGTADSALAIPQFLEFLRQCEDENQIRSLGEALNILKSLRRLSAHKTPLGNLVQSKDAVSLMTIHAAKGLEYESVFLVDLERKGPTSASKLQCLGERFALKYPNAAGTGDVKTPRFEAIRERHRDEEREENHRLLYVAMTRAKKNLTVTLHPDPPAASLQGLLQSALGERAAEWSESVAAAPEGAGEASAPAGLDISGPPPFPRGLPFREFSVSEVETFQVCPLKHHYLAQAQVPDSEWLEGADMNPSEMGTLLHAALRWLAGRPGAGPRAALEAVYRDRLPQPQEEIFAALAATLASYLQSQPGRALAESGEDYSELPFLFQLAAGRIRGQIDRLIRLPDGGWSLVDFKYVTHRTSEAELKASYEFQLKTYALAAEKFLGIAPGLVQIHLLGANKAVDFTFAAGELEAHHRRLEDIVGRMRDPDLKAVTRNPGCFSCAFHERIPLCGVPRGVPWGTRPPLGF